MTKTDPARDLSDKLGIMNDTAQSAGDIVFADIIDALAQGERVNISGFGTFAILARGARDVIRRVGNRSSSGGPNGKIQAGQSNERIVK
jgi:nucleoid DNA-binding protein